MAFLIEHLFDEQMVLTDSSDELWFQALDGVDHYSRLGELGIDLTELYRMQRQEILSEVSELEDSRQSWEDVYDQVGLDPGEIRMRQRIKKQAKEAKTVEEVARLVEGTYFDVLFCRSDEKPAWGSFDSRDCSASPLDDESSSRQASRITIDRQSRVKHVASGEDIHLFELIDLPREG